MIRLEAGSFAWQQARDLGWQVRGTPGAFMLRMQRNDEELLIKLMMKPGLRVPIGSADHTRKRSALRKRRHDRRKRFGAGL
jgi:hypothetical protein